MSDLKPYLAELHEVLLTGDLDRVEAFRRRHHPRHTPPRSRHTVEAGMHKARTALRSLPLDVRLESKRWLTERGMRSLDEGELKETLQ